MNTVTYRVGSSSYLLTHPTERTLHMSSYWAYQWCCGHVLAEELSTHVGNSRALLELGPGLGLCAAVAAEVNYRVTVVDKERSSLEYTATNCRLNGQKEPIVIEQSWSTFLKTNRTMYDVIIGGDILYDINQVPILLSIFSTSLKLDGTIYITDASRPPHRIYQTFLDELDRRGFQYTEQLITSKILPEAPNNYDMQDIRLATITRKIR